MKLNLLLADTGRPVSSGGALNLLNAGWTFTAAIPLPDGGYTLPDQAIAIFVEGSWDELNRPHELVIELVDDESTVAMMETAGGRDQLRITDEITIPPVAGAANGTPGLTSVLLNMPGGTIVIPSGRRRYIWRASIGDVVGEVGFWVHVQPKAPVFGGGTAE